VFGSSATGQSELCCIVLCRSIYGYGSPCELACDLVVGFELRPVVVNVTHSPQELSGDFTLERMLQKQIVSYDLTMPTLKFVHTLLF
jgi:hypothetical protein